MRLWPIPAEFSALQSPSQKRLLHTPRAIGVNSPFRLDLPLTVFWSTEREWRKNRGKRRREWSRTARPGGRGSGLDAARDGMSTALRTAAKFLAIASCSEQEPRVIETCSGATNLPFPGCGEIPYSYAEDIRRDPQAYSRHGQGATKAAGMGGARRDQNRA